MKGRDVEHGDMWNVPWLTPGFREPPEIEGRDLDGLLEGGDRPEVTDPALTPVAEVLAVLKAPASADELRGEEAARAEFRHRAEGPFPGGRARGRRRGRLARLVPVQAAAAAVLVAAAGIAAAYTGSLPASLQRLAHQTIRAPAARGASPGPSPAGTMAPRSFPSGSVSALCAAYRSAQAEGTSAQRDAAFHRLVLAAGGTAEVTAYCAGPSVPPASPAVPDPAAGPGTADPQRSAHPPSANPTHQSHPPRPSLPSRPARP